MDRTKRKPFEIKEYLYEQGVDYCGALALSVIKNLVCGNKATVQCFPTLYM